MQSQNYFIQRLELDISIRKLRKEDYPSVNILIVDELGYRDSTPDDYSKRLDSIQNHTDFYTLVAVADNKVVGFIGMCRSFAYEFTGEYMRIVALAVNSSYQKMGIGKMLVESAEQYARSKNILGLSLDSGFHREGAHAFYEKIGFNKCGYHFGKKL